MEQEARAFVEIKIYLARVAKKTVSIDGISQSIEEEESPRIYRNGEFWIAGDLLFVSHQGTDAGTAKLKMFNIGWVKQVSLTYGI